MPVSSTKQKLNSNEIIHLKFQKMALRIKGKGNMKVTIEEATCT